MKLNPTEWTRAQELLLRLIDVLKPLESKQNPLAGAPRLFFPFSHSSLFNEGGPVRFYAHLLTDLTDAKKEVEDWIGKLPVYSTKTLNKTAQEKQEEPISATPPPNLSHAIPEKRLPISLLSLNTNRKQPVSPVETHAQKLIEQVRGAILSLSTSSYLFDPKAEPLCDALKRLKPLIEQLIDAVSQEGILPAVEGTLAPSRFKTKSFEREILLKELVSFPRENFKNRPLSASPSSEDRQTERKEKVLNLPRESLPKMKGTALASGASDSALSPSKESVPKTVETVIQNKPTERTSIPSAPYLSSTPLSFSPRKPKKKRKGFWFREDETSPERDNS